ncbi:TetR family transcriptional regulator [Streptomyces sp. NPDC001941]|uniref:TetR/AcrR family transcriptional regulator n=1 Tax=Streptomyces sp. NPDC001941 TaxID=3154659 RepID=UPI00331B3B24
MRQNPERRTALLDAAIEVLAREGSRGLTLRAVDAEAGVPLGTSSNYFRNRAQMLGQIMRRTRERLVPDATQVTAMLKEPHTPELVTRFMWMVREHLHADRSSHLAMLELRLEGTRHPELRAELNQLLGDELENNVAFHVDSGLPGDEATALLMYFAMFGMAVDELTIPEAMGKLPLHELIATMARRLTATD